MRRSQAAPEPRTITPENPQALYVLACVELEAGRHEEATQALVEAIETEDTEALAAISKVWSNDFNYTELPEDEGLRLSNGAYIMTEMVADQFVTLNFIFGI